VETPSATPLLLFTLADLGGRSLFRAVTVELSTGPGDGRLWLDVSRRRGFDASWQRHLQHLAALGRAHYDLPWSTVDLRVSARAESLALEGWSAALPVFVAWLSLLSGAPLPEPFLAAGVVDDRSDALLAGKREFIQGKLDVADALVRQRYGAAARHRMWIPAGSEHDPSRLSSIDVVEVPNLREAARRILGLVPGEKAS
jgi:hypothetical protein